MRSARHIALHMRTRAGQAIPFFDLLVLRTLLARRPARHQDPETGDQVLVFEMDEAELESIRNNDEPISDAPTSEGIVACLRAVAQEARQIDLHQAAWAIELSIQLIGLSSDRSPTPMRLM